MGYSNYPNGFNQGVLMRDVLNVDAVPSKVFYVGNNATLLKGELGASDGNDGSFLKPFSTIDYAIGQCAAGRGDVILVRPSHATTVTAAGGITMDVDGVQLIGLGVGEDRPIVTFSTAAAASLVLSAANCVIKNILFKNAIDSQDHMIDITGKDNKIVSCEFREGASTQALSHISADTADNDSDRLEIIGCKFYAPTAGANQAIDLAKDFNSVRIIDCDIYGDFANAGISVPAGGNAQVDLRVIRCRVDNLQTGDHAIEMNGTGNTGMIIECYLQGDTLAAIVDTGGLSMFQCYVHDKADQSYAIVTGTAVS